MSFRIQTSIKRLQERDKNGSFEDSHYPRWWDEETEPKPEAGLSKGLKLVLDAHSDLVAGSSISEDIDGFLAIIDDKHQFPMTTRKTVFIRPGHTNNVALKITQVKADKTAKEAATPEKRLCYFFDEMKNLEKQNKEMKMFSKYSQGNCFLECGIEYAIQKMGEDNGTQFACLPWYFPKSKGADVKMCNPFDSFKFLNHMKNVSQSSCEHCLPDCVSTMYDSSVTAAPFRRCDYKNLGVSPLCSFESTIEPQIWAESLLTEYESSTDGVPTYVYDMVGDRSHPKTNKRYYVRNTDDDINRVVFAVQNENNKEYDAYEKDIAMVTFFFESPTAFVYERKARMTWVGFISQIGGLFGLCMGFSFISIIEIGYWITVRMFKNTLL